MEAWILLILFLKLSKGLECPDLNNQTSVCDFWQNGILNYQGFNLEAGLKCVGYNKNQSSNHVFGIQEEQMILGNMNKILIHKVNEVDRSVKIEIYYKVRWNDERLKVPGHCKLQKYKKWMNRKSFNYLWFSNFLSPYLPKNFRYFSIDQVRLDLQLTIF